MADRICSQGDAELLYGAFRNRLSSSVRDGVYAATKWCVFGPLGRPVTTQLVLEGVKERFRRLGGRIELLQFHWYDVSFAWLEQDSRKGLMPSRTVLLKRVPGHPSGVGQSYPDPS